MLGYFEIIGEVDDVVVDERLEEATTFVRLSRSQDLLSVLDEALEIAIEGVERGAETAVSVGELNGRAELQALGTSDFGSGHEADVENALVHLGHKGAVRRPRRHEWLIPLGDLSL